MPTTEAQALRKQSVLQNGGALNTKSAQILVVDDESQVTGLIERILRREGYLNVTSLNQPECAVELCREIKPDLVLLDLNMPNLSGFEVLAQIQLENYDFETTPVVVLTGERGREARMRALNLGARDYIFKPFDFEVLARIRNLLEHRLLSKSLFFHNQILEERVQQRTFELQEAHVETVRRLGLAAEFRDDDTGEHVVRICESTRLLATALGEEAGRAVCLGLAAKLHDIGKLGIPDSILLKPGRLSEAEFEVMKRHTVIGANILSGAHSTLLQTAQVIAMSHHEKWDGTGYPAGLAGEAIPHSARLVAVCDVFDALTSRRPYKEAWPVEKAVSHIREQSGRHFDPAIVEAFLSILDDVVSLREA